MTSEPLASRDLGAPSPGERHHHYRHAPIIEAIIELSCDLAADTSLEDLTRVVDPNLYTLVGPAVAVSGRIEVSPDGIKGDSSGEQVGHVFRRTDGLRLVQSRLNGISYSALAPYDRWEAFSSEALQQWQAFKEIAHPVKLIRIGVRFINKIVIPKSRIEIKDYLRTAVDVSPYLPQVTEHYFLQVVVPLPDLDAHATITSTAVQPDSPESAWLILDIDTWRLLDFASDDDVDEGIQAALNDLRDAKNLVFEACITDATRGLIS